MAVIKILLDSSSTIFLSQVEAMASFNYCPYQDLEHINSNSFQRFLSHAIHFTQYFFTSSSPTPFTLWLLHSLDTYTIMTCIHLIGHSISQQIHTHSIIIHIYQPWDQQASPKNSYCCYIMFVCIPLSQVAMSLVLLEVASSYNLLKLSLPNYSLINSLPNIFHLLFSYIWSSIKYFLTC